jgi:hypothetical protein
VDDLTPWQNLFFVSAAPSAPPDLKATLTGDGGAWTISNDSPHRLSGCIIVVATGGGAAPAWEWHYLDALEPAGQGDARAPLSQATHAPQLTSELAQRLRGAAPSDLTGAAMVALLGLPDKDAVIYRDYGGPQGVQQMLADNGLLPAEGEYLLLCMLPEDAISKGSAGLRGVEPDRIGQASLWAARGPVQAR